MSIIKDSMQVLKIAMAVASLFNLNAIQEAELKNYEKLQQNEWIERRKHDSEIEVILKNEAQRICGE